MDRTRVDDIDLERLEALAEGRIGLPVEGFGELEEIIGVGGIGAVYRASGNADGPVAVKVMHGHLATNETLQERFLREATILGQVDHKNSVKVYGTGEIGLGDPYFVMELLDGVEVGTIWRVKDRFPMRNALQIVVQALDCLEAYHQADVLHRDLKPENLFLTHDGIVKVIDFGLARFRVEGQTPTKAGTALGTPAYMAPEQALGKQDMIDVRTDIFGLGATLYALLTGDPLHDVEAADAALIQAATEEPDSLSEHAALVPERVADIVDRSLAWERKDRFQTAGEMRDAIQEYLRSEEADDLDEVAAEAEQRGRDGKREGESAEPAPGGWTGVMRDFFEGIEPMLEELQDAEPIDARPRSLKNALAKLRLVIRRRDQPVDWTILPHSIEMDGEVVWMPGRPLERIPYELYRSGFRSLRVTEELTIEEFVGFVRWLGREVLPEGLQTDDPVTRFRERGLTGFDTRIVEVFRWEERRRPIGSAYDTCEGMAAQAVDYLHGQEGMWRGLENLVDPSGGDLEVERGGGEAGVSVSSKIDQPATDFLRSPKGVLSKKWASQLYQSIRSEQEEWGRQFDSVVAEIRAMTNSLEELSAELIEEIEEESREENGEGQSGGVDDTLEGLPPVQARRERSIGGFDWRRVIVRQIYRIFDAAVFEHLDSPVLDRTIGQASERLHRLVEKRTSDISLLFHERGIFVDGVLLRADRDDYETFTEIGGFLAERGWNEIVIDPEVGREEFHELVEVLRELIDAGEDQHQQERESIEPTAHIDLRQRSPSERLGIFEPLTGERPLEVRIARYYSACITTLRVFYRARHTNRAELLRDVKRIAQILVHLSGRSRPAMLALTGLKAVQGEPAGVVLNGAILSVLMARRLTGSIDTLRRICYAALFVPEISASREPASSALGQRNPARTALSVLQSSDGRLTQQRRAVVAYELETLLEQGPSGLRYSGGLEPKVDSVLVEIARRYARYIGSGEGTNPSEAVQEIFRGSQISSQRIVLHLLVDTLGLFTRGMPVELSSGWRGLVLEAKEHITDFHVPTVRLGCMPDGDAVEPTDVDLADAIEEYGYVVRRLDDGSDSRLAELRRELAGEGESEIS